MPLANDRHVICPRRRLRGGEIGIVAEKESKPWQLISTGQDNRYARQDDTEIPRQAMMSVDH